MRITGIETYVLRHKLKEPFGYSQGWYTERTAMLTKVLTDGGVSGWGESFGPPEVSSTIIQTVLKPLIMGEDPLDVEKIWEKMYGRTKDYGQKGIIINAISAIDIAIWDIVGKVLHLPLHKLLGGSFRQKVRVYATGLYFKKTEKLIAELVEEALGYRREGFTAIKMKVGLSPEEDIELVQAVRRAIGEDMMLMVDANHAYDVPTAIKLGRKFEEENIYWFEEPISPEDIDGYVEVTRALDLAVAGGEAEFTRFGFRNLIAKHAVDIVQPDLCIAGGISEGKKIAVMANAFGLRCIPHVWGSAVGLAAALQFIASLPDFPLAINPLAPILEYDRTPNLFREELACKPLRQRDGFIDIPQESGLGIELNEEVINKYLVKKEGTP